MKKFVFATFILLLATMLIMLVSCNPSSAPTPSSPDLPGNGAGENQNGDVLENVLIVYFSCTGTTENIANTMQSVLNCDIFKIQAAEPYSATDLNYSNSNCRANKEQNDASARPKIANSVEDIDKYDTVFIGYPIWWGKAPKIIYTFLEQYDFSDKILVPFCTSGSSPVSGSEGDLHAIASSAVWKSGIRFASNASQNTISAWIDSLNLKKGA